MRWRMIGTAISWLATCRRRLPWSLLRQAVMLLVIRQPCAQSRTDQTYHFYITILPISMSLLLRLQSRGPILGGICRSNTVRIVFLDFDTAFELVVCALLFGRGNLVLEVVIALIRHVGAGGGRSARAFCRCGTAVGNSRLLQLMTSSTGHGVFLALDAEGFVLGAGVGRVVGHDELTAKVPRGERRPRNRWRAGQGLVQERARVDGFKKRQKVVKGKRERSLIPVCVCRRV